MIDLLELQKQFISNHLSPGDAAADYTMGNGHDTAFLSTSVGLTGHVYAFDIQPQALASTQLTLLTQNCPLNYSLILDSHHNANKYIPPQIKINAGMFNLGYLPGGDKSITTKCNTTLPAISNAIARTAPNGILLIAVYPGHPEGYAEGNQISSILSQLNRRDICVSQLKLINSPSSPFFYIIETK